MKIDNQQPSSSSSFKKRIEDKNAVQRLNGSRLEKVDPTFNDSLRYSLVII